MKTAEQIIGALNQMMRSVTERPSMHAENAEALEALLFHLECLRDIATVGEHQAGIRLFKFDDGTTGHGVKAYVEKHFGDKTDDEQCRMIAHYWRKYLDDQGREKLLSVSPTPR